MIVWNDLLIHDIEEEETAVHSERSINAIGFLIASPQRFGDAMKKPIS